MRFTVWQFWGSHYSAQGTSEAASVQQFPQQLLGHPGAMQHYQVFRAQPICYLESWDPSVKLAPASDIEAGECSHSDVFPQPEPWRRQATTSGLPDICDLSLHSMVDAVNQIHLAL